MSAHHSIFDPPAETAFSFLSLGAGVQSSCLALMAATGELGPRLDGAIFADTQAEPASVYTWLDWLEEEIARSPFPFPVHRVTHGNLEELELTMRLSKRSGKVYRKSHIPAFAQKPDGSKGIISRKCTADFKIRPITKWVREAAKITRGQNSITVTQWIGISWDEVQRMKELRENWQQGRWPLVELKMRRDDCKAWMKNKGYPEPPRSACTFCPFHDDNEWRRLRDEEPLEFQRAIDFEIKMQSAFEKDETATSKPFLHPSLIPLSEVDLRTGLEKGQMELWNTIQNECSGMCGV